MLKWIFCFSLFCVVLGCAGQKRKEPQKLDLPKIDPASIGDVRIAIVGRRRKGNLVLVNKSNSSYLKVQNFAKKLPQKDQPMSALRYDASFLSFHDNTAVVIIDDDVMAQMVALLQYYRFDSYTTPCGVKNFKDTGWPERDSIFVEMNGGCSVFTRNPKLVNSSGRESKAGNAYRAVKYYILQAQASGYRPMNVMHNIDGKKMFRRNQQSSQRDAARLRERSSDR